jgi:hypothetical protein
LRTLLDTNRQTWLKYIESISLPCYEMANGRQCVYFTQDMFKTKLQSFEIPDLLSGRRSLIGQVKGKTWHFGISADISLEPVLAYIIRPHVLFSDDGKNIWTSTDRLHRTRRSACKNWWNQHWRDRILAAMYFLAQKSDGNELRVHLSSNESIRISIKPVTFDCLVSYEDSLVTSDLFLDEDQEDYEIETESIAEEP